MKLEVLKLPVVIHRYESSTVNAKYRQIDPEADI